MQLAKPLHQYQIDAALKFWANGWESEEIARLQRDHPNPQDAVVQKTEVLNREYGTYILSVTRVSATVRQALQKTSATGPDLVQAIVDEIKPVTGQRHHVYASKYVHFFVDPSLPIMDWYAEWMASQHLYGRAPKLPRYHKFVHNVETLIQLAELPYKPTDMAPYLWMAGEYWWWLSRPDAKINTDLKECFLRLQNDYRSEPLLATALLGINVN